jgi:ureidoglycolate hydrolase
VAQLFVPVSRKAFVMVVASPTGAGKDAPPDPSAVRAFYLDGSFGLIINRGTWHALDRLPVDDGHVDFFFITELETQQEMSRHAADHPERLERSDIVNLDREIVLVDRNGLLPPGQAS